MSLDYNHEKYCVLYAAAEHGHGYKDLDCYGYDDKCAGHGYEHGYQDHYLHLDKQGDDGDEHEHGEADNHDFDFDGEANDNEYDEGVDQHFDEHECYFY